MGLEQHGARVSFCECLPSLRFAHTAILVISVPPPPRRGTHFTRRRRVALRARLACALHMRHLRLNDLLVAAHRSIHRSNFIFAGVGFAVVLYSILNIKLTFENFYLCHCGLLPIKVYMVCVCLLFAVLDV